MKKIISWIKAVLFIPPPPAEIFETLRQKALHLKPEEIGITKAKYPQPVWAILFEMGLPHNNMALECAVDGTVNLFLSSGGKVMQAGRFDAVRKAATEYLANANNFYSFAQQTTLFTVPLPGQVAFHFLTYDGVYRYSASEHQLGHNDDHLSTLFREAVGVMDQILQISKSTSKHKGTP